MGSDKGKAIAIGAIGIGAALALTSRKAKAQTMPSSVQPTSYNPAKTRIGEFFTLDEFLRSKLFPQLANYRPSEPELFNLKQLVDKLLDPARRKFGPILINSGGRPESIAAAKNTTWAKALSKQGYDASIKSDHTDFSAADIYFAKLPAKDWLTAYQEISASPHARQVILNTKTGKDKSVVPVYMHVAVVIPGLKPPFPGSKHHFLVLDGKQVTAA